jgi:anti-sigma regulatory factor (Ser/Thr protein kinase)
MVSAPVSEASPEQDAPIALRFLPAPEHVRTARLVVVAVARRAGFDDVRLDEVRLATGEVCARAVRRSLASDTAEPVNVGVDDSGSDGPVLRVVVTDDAGLHPEDSLVLALLNGLADQVTLSDGPGGPGGCVTLDWLSPI